MINRHIANLFLFFIFTILVALPFSLFKADVQDTVLGEVYEKPYYKRVTNLSEHLLLRTIAKEDNSEKDFITVSLPENATSNNYSLYEVVNLSDESLSFSVYPSSNVLGDLRGRKIYLKNNYEEVLIFQNDRYVENIVPKLEFTLLSGEKTQISLLIESTIIDTMVSPISFDLILEQH